MTDRVRLFFLGFSAILLTAVGGGVIHPFGSVKSQDGTAMLGGVNVDAQTRELMERACGSCHSERVQWPWYSYVAPTSWLVESDVARARSRINFSHWERYSSEEKQYLLGAVGSAARTGDMPPQRFTLVHPEAALTDGERKRLYDWARAERRRIRDTVSVSKSDARAGQ